MPSLERKDRVKDMTATQGTSTFQLLNTSKPGFRTIASAHTSGVLVNYLAISDDFLSWEVGQGVYTSGSPGTLTRSTILSSSNGGSIVSFGVGNKSIVTLPTARDMRPVFLDKGTVNNPTFDFNAAEWQRWQPLSGTQTPTFINWPLVGEFGFLLLEGQNLGAFSISWSTSINWVKSDGTFTTSFSTLGVTLQTSGIDFITLWTRDSGTTVYGKVTR